MVLSLEAQLGDQVGHIVVVAIGQIEAADFTHRDRVQVVFEGPLLGQAGLAVGTPVDDFGRLLPQRGRRRNLAVQ